jgi:hypothetical protein
VVITQLGRKNPCARREENESEGQVKIATLCFLALLACNHVPAVPARAGPPQKTAGVALPTDPSKAAAELSAEAHTLLRAEGELLWKRWTTGAGPLPASALAEHPRLTQRESVEMVALAAAKASGAEAAALRLLHGQLATWAVAREAGTEIEALERARAQLSFAAPGDQRPERGERDLDRLLTEESNAQKRAAVAAAEAKSAQALAPLVMARDAAVEKAVVALGLASWSALEERAHGMPLEALAALAERTLAATEGVAVKAVDAAAVRNIGVTVDRLRRADLPRLVRSALADSEFPPGRAWPSVRAVFGAIGTPPPASLVLDAEPSPSKGARPLALLVDPPADLRLSLRPAGGFEEQRATLHEGARALGGSLTQTPRWELAQLGDGSTAEGAAQLFEELSGDPLWLREVTGLRGEPLDDLVHTQATRRLLSARRAAAMVLFEVRRREGPRTPEAQAALYRGLLQRATFAVFTDADAGRWALEADAWVRGAAAMEGAVLAAQIDRALKAEWWKSAASGKALQKIWAGGRSLAASDAARVLGLPAIDPAALAAVAEERLAYKAPEAPPPTQKPDYKYMQGDKKRRRHKKKH